MKEWAKFGIEPPDCYRAPPICSWCYIHLLDLAADEDDPVTRLKLVVAFAIGGLRQQVSFGRSGMSWGLTRWHSTRFSHPLPPVSSGKPFNPILGETFCGTFSNGAHAFLEQISHHPPISFWQLYGLEGKVSGPFDVGRRRS